MINCMFTAGVGVLDSAHADRIEESKKSISSPILGAICEVFEHRLICAVLSV